jgi:hypothetical protein
MRALVVYESMFGNTAAVARAIGEGLAEYMRVEVYDVQHAPDPGVEHVDLIVVGGPTHAFSLSRVATRADARKQGATQGPVEAGLREWLDRLDDGPHPELIAAFDTRVAKVRMLPGSAARRSIRIAHAHGYGSVGCQSFYVEGTAGPLLSGELGRACNWGAGLAARIAIPTG